MSAALPPLAGIGLEELSRMRLTLMRSIAGGALSVRNMDGSMVTYRSGAEMNDALRMLDNAIAAAGAAPGSRPRAGRFYFQTSKGL